MCDNLPDPANGDAFSVEGSYGNVATGDGDIAYYSCNAGYEMVGNNLTCLSNGSWSGLPPTCTG